MVATDGLGRYLAQEGARPELQGISQSTPDAPTVASLIASEEMRRQFALEAERIRKENEPLPEPFRIFREQLADAGADADLANGVTDTLVAMSIVAGKRLGLTAEQFLNLNPIQVILQNGIERVRSAGEIADTLEDHTFAREASTAQKAYVLHQKQYSGERKFLNTSSGKLDFSVIPQDKASRFGLKPLPIRLEEGTSTFGGQHIEEKHGDEIRRAGFENVIDFVEFVANNFEYIVNEGNRNALIAMTPNKANIIVVELIEENGFYTVVTGHTQNPKKKIRGQRPWAERTTLASDLGNPNSLSLPPDNSAQAGTAVARGNQGLPENNIPSAPADVNAWNQEALDTLLRQSGVPPEQADAFRQYVQNLIDQGEDVQDAKRLRDEFQAALTSAEGLEQAAQGLERILAQMEQEASAAELAAQKGDPDAVLARDIGAAVFQAMSIDAAGVREGMAAIRERVNSLRERAGRFRNFHQDPDTLGQVRESVAPDDGRRGEVAFTPDVNIVRVFNGRQDRSTVMHELFHIYFRHLEKAAKGAPVGSQLARDYLVLNEASEGGLVSEDPDVRRQAEERVDALFEKYLSEGQAPKPSLSETFRRFRRWIRNFLIASEWTIFLVRSCQEITIGQLFTEERGYSAFV